MDIPSIEPTQIRAGDSVAWQRELSEYSAADGWVLKYRILWPAGTPDDITASGVGTLHSVALAAATTAAYTAGSATLVAYVENSITGARDTLKSIPITILPDLVAATALDGRSAATIALANLRAALDSMAANKSLTVLSISLEGRSTTFRSMQELRDAITHYEQLVFNENAALALMNGVAAGRVQVRF